MLAALASLWASRLPYRDWKLPVAQRVSDLLSRMTLEEKIGQLQQHDNKNRLADLMAHQPGGLLSVMGEDARAAIAAANATRLRIPLLLGIDAIHGHGFWPGATVFPTQLGIAQSWDEALIEMMGNVTAFEMRYTGVHWTFAPVLCIARDLRWGRVGETFGEDPLLVGRFALAVVRGLQGRDGISADPDKVLATAKHYAGYSETEGGRDAAEADLPLRKLKSWFLGPFEQVARAGVGSFMTAYQAIEGVPMSANRALVRETLKSEWGFTGFVVTDYDNVGYLVDNFRVARTYKDAAITAVEAGNDMMMAAPMFYQGAFDAVTGGELDVALVDAAVARILRTKFMLGLFEDPRPPDPLRAARRIGSAFSRSQAQQAAEESLVLLKNNGSLPLNEATIKSIAIVGPNADHAVHQNGDWTLGTGQLHTQGQYHPRNASVTVLDGFRERFRGKILYDPGATIEATDSANLSAAMAAVLSADVTVAVVGDRYPYYGERKSTATMELMGTQRELLEAIRFSGKPFILVVISSKPLCIHETIRNRAAAIIWQFCPGMLGGRATARAIFGDINPCGRLTVSIPFHVGQQPCYYQQFRGQHGWTYADMTQEPAYPFGFGLSYSTVEFRSAVLNKEVFKVTDKIVVTVTVENPGKIPAIEVIQVYVSDLVTSVTWVDQELKGFKRIKLAPKEIAEVEIVIPVKDLSIVDADAHRVVEPGEFELRVGKSSKDITHKISFEVAE
jgi:beta-glucosidase